MLNYWLSKNKNEIIELRHWLHAHPEIGFDELETAAHLKELLESAGYEINQTSEMKTGFTCEYCNVFSAPTKKSLSAHVRACKKQHDITVDTPILCVELNNNSPDEVASL